MSEFEERIKIDDNYFIVKYMHQAYSVPKHKVLNLMDRSEGRLQVKKDIKHNEWYYMSTANLDKAPTKVFIKKRKDGMVRIYGFAKNSYKEVILVSVEEIEGRIFAYDLLKE